MDLTRVNMNAHQSSAQVVEFSKGIIRLSKKRRISGDSNQDESRATQHDPRRIFNADVDSYDFSDIELVEMALDMLQHFDVYDALHTDVAVMRSFMNSVRRLYVPENAFHNFKHVWAVMHSVFHILDCGAAAYMDKIDIFIVLISALCHDLGHPGNNNDFENITNSDISKHHGTLGIGGVLECHHACLARHLLVAPEHDVLRALSAEARDSLLERMTYVVMGTDMGIHSTIETDLNNIVSDLVSQSVAGGATAKIVSTAANVRKKISKTLKTSEQNNRNPSTVASGTPTRLRESRNSSLVASLAASSSSSSSSILSPIARVPSDSIATRLRVRKAAACIATGKDIEIDIIPPESLPSIAQRDTLMRCIVHSADIGAQTGDLPLARKWMTRAYAEFYSQAKREDALSIYTSTFIHRASDELHKYLSQCSFIENVVEPLWKSLKTIFPKLTPDYQQLLVNKAAYQLRAVEMMEEAKSFPHNSKRM